MEELEKRIEAECEKYKGLPVAVSGGVDSALLACLIKPKFIISVELPGDEKYNEIEWAKKVANQLGLEHVIVTCPPEKFDEYCEIAVKAIGRPIPHFNIFPLFCMYKKLHEMGVKEVVLGDGPDEVMCGYGRDLILFYIYSLYNMEAFKNYRPILDQILMPLPKAIKKITGIKANTIIEANILMRKDMDDMSNKIAEYFGIKNIRPYQDNPELDNYMRNLPIESKINGEYGKWELRRILAQYLPEIADRIKKVGGPVYPVNQFKGWLDKGEFNKEQWIKYQKEILKKD